MSVNRCQQSLYLGLEPGNPVPKSFCLSQTTHWLNAGLLVLQIAYSSITALIRNMAVTKNLKRASKISTQNTESR
jgi:hypothetical protein